MAPFTPFPPSFRIPGPPSAAPWSAPGFLPGPPKSGQHRGGQQAGSQGPSLDSWGPRYQQQHSKVSDLVSINQSIVFFIGKLHVIHVI